MTDAERIDANLDSILRASGYSVVLRAKIIDWCADIELRLEAHGPRP